ncbi:MAG: TIGR03032 family protein [Planctomycetota bacterium]
MIVRVGDGKYSRHTHNIAQTRDKTGPSMNQEPLSSVHTDSCVEILASLGLSLAVTTYQAGHLIFFRVDGHQLNTHFRSFDKPMGVASDGARLAVGAAHAIWQFHDLPAVASAIATTTDKSDTPASNARIDACYLPRTTHWTGDVQVHEMAFCGSEGSLQFINTRFSCLCQLSSIYNFTPVWRPSFIDHYAPTDQCHLNGMAVVDGEARYFTALGDTADDAGWRQNKRDGGILLDRKNDIIMLEGLSMPHSPRVHRDELYLLESGRGALCRVDIANGRTETIIELPGFVRGLDFVGQYAFVGLSQIRETATFGDVPVAKKALEDRPCGVWIVDLDRGEVVGFVRFEDQVREIFAVKILPHKFPELINDDRTRLAGSFELPPEVLENL